MATEFPTPGRPPGGPGPARTAPAAASAAPRCAASARRAVAVGLWLSVAALSAPAGAATAAPPVEPLEQAVERLCYRWQVRGLEGFLAWLLLRVPSSGEGVLSSWQEDDGRLRSEFRATSPGVAAGDHWTYSAEIDLGGRRTLSVVEALRFRGREKDRRFDLEAETAVDGVAVLHLLRRELPERPQRFEIWSNGKTYPVIVHPRGRVLHEIEGRPRVLSLYTVRGVREGGRRLWRAEADLWFDGREPATPVEIGVRRRLGSARLRLIREQPDP